MASRVWGFAPLLVLLGCGGVAASPEPTPASAGAVAGGAGAFGEPNGAGQGGDGGMLNDAGTTSGGNAGVSEGGELQRVFAVGGMAFRPISQCTPSDDIQDGCFPITDQIGIVAEPVTEATSCSMDTFGTDPDQCACQGLSCASDQICRPVMKYCSCAPDIINTCSATPCRSVADCAAGTVCLPDQFVFDERCVPVSCSSDSDCTTGYRGRCSVVFSYPQQQGEIWLRQVSCRYEATLEHPATCLPGELIQWENYANEMSGTGIYECVRTR